MKGGIDLSRLGPIDQGRLLEAREEALRTATDPNGFIDERVAAREYTRLVSSMPNLAQAVIGTMTLAPILKADLKAHVGGSKSPAGQVALNGQVPMEARELLESTPYVRDYFRLRNPDSGWDTIRRDDMERPEWIRAQDLRREKQQETGRQADVCGAIVAIGDQLGLTGPLAPQILTLQESQNGGGGS